MPVATPLRLAAVAAWCMLFGFHVASHLWASRGEERALSLDARIDRRASYDIMVRSQQGERLVGSCVVTCVRAGTRCRLTTRGTLVDAAFVPGLDALLRQLGSAATDGERATVAVTEEFDAGPWLRSLSVDAEAGSVSAHLDADLSASGVRGRWSVVSGPEGRVDFPAFVPSRLQGLQLIAALPPGLTVGDRFSAELLGMDAVARAPARRRAVFAVTAEEVIEVDGRTMLLDRVDISIDGSPLEQAWCDRSGMVFIQRARDLGVSIELRRLDGADGSLLWPRSSAP